MQELASTTPSLSFEIVDRRVVLSYHLLKKCTVNFYTMNTEVLFSFEPFLKGKSGGDEKSVFSYIAPNESVNVVLPEEDVNGDGGGSVTVDIPQSLQNENLFVEVVSDTLTESQPFYDHSLVVEMKANYGTLRVLKKEQPDRWVKRAYVKVYAKMRDGSVCFYKDGYTDIRGGFDYASISTDQLDRAQKFSILVAHPQHGCLVKEATVPKR